MDMLKSFLFDNGLSLKLSEQTEDKINHMVIHLIENEHVSIPVSLKCWYQSHRQFNFTLLYPELIYEVVKFIVNLESFRQVNHYYNHHIKNYILFKKIGINSHFLYNTLLSKKLYQCQFLARRLMAVLEYEKYPDIFLMANKKNNEDFKLLTYYPNKFFLEKHNQLIYTYFNLKLNTTRKILYYIYITDDKKQCYGIPYENLFDLLLRFYYYYDNHIPSTQNELRFDVTMLKKQNKNRPELKNEIENRLHFMITYTKENYVR